MQVNDDQSRWHFNQWVKFQDSSVDMSAALEGWNACRDFYESEVIRLMNLTRGITPEMIETANQVLASQDQRQLTL